MLKFDFLHSMLSKEQDFVLVHIPLHKSAVKISRIIPDVCLFYLGEKSGAEMLHANVLLSCVECSVQIVFILFQERITALHTAKASRLETQLSYTRLVSLLSCGCLCLLKGPPKLSSSRWSLI